MLSHEGKYHVDLQEAEDADLRAASFQCAYNQREKDLHCFRGAVCRARRAAWWNAVWQWRWSEAGAAADAAGETARDAARQRWNEFSDAHNKGRIESYARNWGTAYVLHGPHPALTAWS